LYAKLGRFRIGPVYLFGDGLGNSLLVWARAMIASEQTGLPMLTPVWRRLTSGGGWLTAVKTMFLPDSARRTYGNLFEGGSDWRSSVRDLLVLAHARHLDESAFRDSVSGGSLPSGSIVFVFRNSGDGFEILLPYRTLIRRRFAEMLQPGAIRSVQMPTRPWFACHVRLGDFRAAHDSVALAQVNARLPFAWYSAQIQKVAAAWPGVPIEIFSDGTNDELSPLLSRPGVTRANYGSPLADLVAMSQSRLLICSGSTFTAWAAFLGDCSTIWFPGKLNSLFGKQRLPNSVELTIQHPLPEQFLESVMLAS
jgi:hypothetical protein